jgi:hypothetical protein
MRYKITATTKAMIGILCDMVADTRKLLGAASPAAREEWDLLRPRFPTADDVLRGFVSHSEDELIQIRFGLQRFRATLGLPPAHSPCLTSN